MRKLFVVLQVYSLGAYICIIWFEVMVGQFYDSRIFSIHNRDITMFCGRHSSSERFLMLFVSVKTVMHYPTLRRMQEATGSLIQSIQLAYKDSAYLNRLFRSVIAKPEQQITGQSDKGSPQIVLLLRALEELRQKIIKDGTTWLFGLSVSWVFLIVCLPDIFRTCLRPKEVRLRNAHYQKRMRRRASLWKLELRRPLFALNNSGAGIEGIDVTGCGLRQQQVLVKLARGKLYLRKCLSLHITPLSEQAYIVLLKS